MFVEIIRRDRSNRYRLDRLRKDGTIVEVLPGLYAHTAMAGEWTTKIAALAEHDPAAVITREAAAALQWWPQLPITLVTAARRGSRVSVPGFAWEQRRVDDIRIAGGVQVSSPALTVLDLLDTVGDRALFEAVASTWMARVAALAHFDPSAVVTREAAAAAQWWPSLDVASVTASRVGGSRSKVPGFTWEQRRVDDIRVFDGVPFASPLTTVIDLLDSVGEQALFEALRRRVVSVGQLQQALPAHARGVRAKRALLAEASDEPWSILEFQAHRHLREAGITGWKANYRVRFDRFLTASSTSRSRSFDWRWSSTVGPCMGPTLLSVPTGRAMLALVGTTGASTALTRRPSTTGRVSWRQCGI